MEFDSCQVKNIVLRDVKYIIVVKNVGRLTVFIIFLDLLF